MKKIALAFVSVLMMTFAVQAQHVFNKENLGINAGLGLGGFYEGGYIPSIEISGEYGVIPTGDIGLVSFGGLLGYKYSVGSYNLVYYNESYSYSQFELGGRAAWHLRTFTSDKWDVYAGLGIGAHLTSDNTVEYNYNTEKYETKRTARTGAYSEAFVGGRMMTNSGFGLFAELGYSKLSALRIGITFLM